MGNINLFDPFTNPNYFKESDKALMGMFSSRIKESFLKGMRTKIINEHPELLQYFHFGATHETMITGATDSSFEYEICRNITSIHRFNNIGLTDAERVANEKSDSYKNKLASQVMEQIQIRDHAAIYFRKRPFFVGEDWIFYPLTYKVFAICIKANELLAQKTCLCNTLFATLFNKVLSALTVMEDSFLDNVYPLARGATDIFMNLILLLDHQEAIPAYERLVGYEIERTARRGENPQGLKDDYKNRTVKTGGILDYLHFGWVDSIADYHQIVTQKPYSFVGLIAYAKSKYGQQTENYYDFIDSLHTVCHAFTHGVMGNWGYQLVHYMDLTALLSQVALHAYSVLTEIVGDDGYINGVDMITNIKNDFNVFSHQYSSKSTEMFETFHNYKKNG